MELVIFITASIFLRGAISETVFTQNKIIPDVLDKIPATLEVKYGGNAIDSGESLSVSATASAPELSWRSEEGAKYTVIMADPDAPSRAQPSQREWLHWLVVNVDGQDLGSGQTLTSYNGPSPPPGTGKHRYVVMVFKQENAVTAAVPSRRNKFSTKKFAKDNNLDIVAANFYQAEVTRK